MEFVMSRTTEKTTATADRPLHVVATAPAGTSDTATRPATAETKIRNALRDHPDVTTAKLAMAAGIGRSTAAKILARWATEGTVIRTTGKDQRHPATWTIHGTTDATENDDDAQDTASATSDDDHNVPDTDCTDCTEDAATSGTFETTDAAPPATDAAALDTSSVSEPDHDDGTADGGWIVVPRPGDASAEGDSATSGDTAAEETPDPQTGPDGADEPSADSAVEEQPAPPSLPETKERLPKGALRGMVEDYLAEHPDDSFGPAKIGRDLNKSGGAVNNALEKLVSVGCAIKTCEAPKRFAYKTGTADAE
jgi:hypothetical protein